MSATPAIAVPFADLHAQYISIRGELDAAIAEVIAGSAFIRGPFVENFERAFAEAMGVAHCVSCANGTDSLYIAMHALGVKPGDEVIAPAHSWISTTETITQAGGKVVFCDTDAACNENCDNAVDDDMDGRPVAVLRPYTAADEAARLDDGVNEAIARLRDIVADVAEHSVAGVSGVEALRAEREARWPS